MFLLVTLWKIPPNGKEIRIPLPHGIRPDTKGVCLFTKDESNLTSEETENFYKQLLKNKGITSITEEENQGNKIATNSLQVSVRPERECGLDDHELEAEKESIAEPDNEDKVPQLVPVQAAFSQKHPELHKAALIKDSTEESINAETSQAKTPDEKRKASMALGTPEEINKNCTELNKTPDSGKHKKPKIDA
uniref:Uncharacterized protein n=1 Tax=Sarcophilus harrisii TaxID=9305 RepID=A0A7N4P5V4_SARHA